MRRYLMVWVCAAGTMGLIHTLHAAQDPRRSTQPNIQPNIRPQSSIYPQPSAQPNPQCMGQRTILTHQQQLLDNTRAEMAGVDAEMMSMRRRLEDLQRRRNELQGQLATYQNQTNGTRQTYQQQCAGMESCSDYETRAAQLQMQARPIQDQMNILNNDITATQTETTQASQQANALRAEYQQRNCGNLVAGQTSQDDIDRCSQIFSEWNRVQITVNQLNGRMPMLRSRYDQLAVQQESLNRRAQDLSSNMTRSCSTSPRINDLNQFAQVWRDAAAMHQALDRISADTQQLAQVRMTVGP